MGAREVLAKLRRDTRRPEIEDLEHQAREQERLEEYVVALRRERMGVRVDLDRLRKLRPEARTWMPFELQEGEPPTVAKRIAEGEQRIADIGAEIVRVAGDALGLE